MIEIFKKYPWKNFLISGMILTVLLIISQIILDFDLILNHLIIQIMSGWIVLFLLSIIVMWIVS